MYLLLLDASIVEPESLQTKLEFLSKVLEALPAGNKVILEHLMAFLFTVSTFKSNCMSVPNIAIVFAPNLMRPKVERIESILTNSSSVNLIISLLIQHHEVLFHGKEFQDAEAGADVVLSPQLISLKMAQSLHSKTGSLSAPVSPGSVPTSPGRLDDQAHTSAELNPVSPRGPKPRGESNAEPGTPNSLSVSHPAKRSSSSASRKSSDKPIRRSQTVSSPTTVTSGGDKKKGKRGAAADQDEFSDITVDDLNSASLALEGTLGSESDAAKQHTREVKRKKSRRGNISTGGGSASGAKDDQFLDTLKKGTIRLAATLLEEQELVLEMAEIDVLSVEERHAVEAKVAKKISESKSLRDNSRKQRQVQRTQTSNFTHLRDGMIHKRSASSDKSVTSDEDSGAKKTKKVKKSPSTIAAESGSSTPLPASAAPSPSPSSLDVPQPDSEASSVVDIENDPAIAQFEEELDRQLSLEDEKNPLSPSPSDSESDSPDFELLHAVLPLPLPTYGDVSISGDAAWVGNINESSEEDRVAEAIMEGDMQHFHEYLGSMKRKKRLDRSVSKKKILSRMSLNAGSSSVTSSSAPPAAK